MPEDVGFWGYDEENSQAYCRLCNHRWPAGDLGSLPDMQDHAQAHEVERGRA